MFNQYQPNIDNMQQYLAQEQEKSNRGDGPNWWSIPSGMSSIRILPPWDPTGRVALPVFMHPIEFKSPDMSYTKYNWTCVNKTFNKPCAICEGLANLAAAGVNTENWEANRRQYYFNAIIMQDPTYNPQKNTGVAPGTHVLMKAPKTFYDWVIAQITNPMIGDITNVQNGIDIYVTKEGSGLGTTYSMTLSPNGRTPIPEEYLSKITDLYNLDDVFSAGFDKKQTDELVDHLRRSSGAMSAGVSQTVNQMAGYTQAPPQQQGYPTYPQGGLNYNQPMNPPQQMPQQFTPAQNPVAPAPNMAPAASPFTPNAAVPTPPPAQPAVAPTPVAPQTAQSPVAPATTAPDNAPTCYGNYDPGNVSCVVCPHEVQCSQSRA